MDGAHMFSTCHKLSFRVFLDFHSRALHPGREGGNVYSILLSWGYMFRMKMRNSMRNEDELKERNDEGGKAE